MAEGRRPRLLLEVAPGRKEDAWLEEEVAVAMTQTMAAAAAAAAASPAAVAEQQDEADYASVP